MRSWKRAVGAVALVVVVAGTAIVSAQAPTNPNILAAVQALQATMNGLVTTVGSLATTIGSLVTTVNRIDASVAEGNVLFTPTAFVSLGDQADCSAVNVNSQARSVQVQLFTAATGAQLTQSTLQLDPGKAVNLFWPAPASGVQLFCKVTVSNGVKSDVRAGMAVFTTGASASDKYVVPAQ